MITVWSSVGLRSMSKQSKLQQACMSKEMKYFLKKKELTSMITSNVESHDARKKTHDCGRRKSKSTQSTRREFFSVIIER